MRRIVHFVDQQPGVVVVVVGLVVVQNEVVELVLDFYVLDERQQFAGPLKLVVVRVVVVEFVVAGQVVVVGPKLVVERVGVVSIVEHVVVQQRHGFVEWPG